MSAIVVLCMLISFAAAVAAYGCAHTPAFKTARIRSIGISRVDPDFSPARFPASTR